MKGLTVPPSKALATIVRATILNHGEHSEEFRQVSECIKCIYAMPFDNGLCDDNKIDRRI